MATPHGGDGPDDRDAETRVVSEREHAAGPAAGNPAAGAPAGGYDRPARDPYRPEETLPPDAPATIEDVRRVRRWVWVAGIWAVAATVIAIIALLSGGG